MFVRITQLKRSLWSWWNNNVQNGRHSIVVVNGEIVYEGLERKMPPEIREFLDGDHKRIDFYTSEIGQLGAGRAADFVLRNYK